MLLCKVIFRSDIHQSMIIWITANNIKDNNITDKNIKEDKWLDKDQEPLIEESNYEQEPSLSIQ